MAFVPGFVAPVEKTAGDRWLVFSGDRLCAGEGGELPVAAALGDGPDRFGRIHYVGALDGVQCYAVEADGAFQPPPGFGFRGLRSLLGIFNDELFTVAGRAFQIVEWERTHRFCSRCGHGAAPKRDERAMLCPACGFTSYPKVSPAVIVAVTRGREILLARSHRFPGSFYSVLAGFVESGETLEDCVRREVKEEVGVDVANVRYVASQPWPFPHSLMIGFAAEYAGGEIVVDPVELSDARWFAADALPDIPKHGTIARRLIDGFINELR